MRRNSASSVAFGGVMAALALVIMCLGSMIPLATYVCPMLCSVLLTLVLRATGTRLAWAWYGAVAILSVLLSPDKEAAAVFVFLGYYPVVKPWIDGRRFSFLWKLLLFNASIFLMYWLLIYLFGLENVAEDFAELGTVMTVVTLLMGNVTLFLLDIILTRFGGKSRRG